MDFASSVRPIRIMVSSAVYGLESVLDLTYDTLTKYGYEVWMSHKGTIPTDPRKSNFQNCLDAVGECDFFLGIITGRYGSAAPGERSIVHQEMCEAVRLKRTRWFLVQREVVIARQLLKQFRSADGCGWTVPIRPSAVLQDARVIEMYEEAIQHRVPLAERTGNWAQEYSSDQDVLRFLHSQFSDLQRSLGLIAPR